MDIKDRACFNCEACSLIKIPNVGARTEENYQVFLKCRQRLSDHYRHLLSILHVCSWHSDTVSQDSRYPEWRDSIDIV